MTREEALGILTHNWTRLENPNYEESELDKAYYMAIESLQGDMYCPNCGVRLVQEDEYLEPTQTHGRLIDADTLSKKLCETTIFIKDGEVFQRMINDAPTEQAETVHKPDYSYETDMARRLIEETLKNKLQELAQCDDYEMAHMKADKLLCDFITKLGYGEVAQKFGAVPKWYA